MLREAKFGGHSDEARLAEIEKELDEAQEMMTSATDRGDRDRAIAIERSLRSLKGSGCGGLAKGHEGDG